MTPARIADLLEPFLAGPLSDGQLTQISIYIDLLLRWNARINLTAIRDPDSIVTRHFGESLFCAQTLFPALAASTAAESSHPHVGTAALARGPEPARSSWDGVVIRPAEQASAELSHSKIPLDLLDIGSGAGFPGLPIKLWAPHLRTTLLESQSKKVAFLREVIRALTLTEIDVLPARAEAISAKSSLVTLRAVENFDSILPAARKLVAPQGRLALLIGESQIAQAHHLCPTLAWHPPLPIPQSSSRVLQTAVVP